MNWYLKAFSHYADFSGRARRMEYWMFTFFNIIIAFFLLVVDYIIIESVKSVSFSPLYIIYFLISFVPSVSVSVRRLHDIGKSGWMILISLIPIIGSIWLLILLLIKGENDDNEYGRNPKNIMDKQDLSTESTVNLKKEEVTNDVEPEFKGKKEKTKRNINYSAGVKENKKSSIIIPIMVSLIGFVLMAIIILFFIRESISKNRTEEEISEIVRILEKRKKELGFYPNELNEIIGMNPTRIGIDIDFWGNDYYYELVGNQQSYILISKGKDGVLGTSDDISN